MIISSPYDRLAGIMVLCAVDDLMFVSRLRTAASHSGVEMRFVRSPEALAEEARTETPTLVILDLNADRLRPFDMIAVLRGNAGLATVRAVGFVQHTQTDRVAAARAAGLDEVMARSAFVTQLPALLQSGA
jgi:PleD family two-component response regulator